MRRAILTGIVLGIGLVMASATALHLARTSSGHVTQFDSVTPLTAANDPVITLLHYFESGRQVVEKHLDQLVEQGVTSRQALDNMRDACVRVEVIFNEQGGHSQQVLASGVVVDDRYVITAGHSLHEIEDYRFEVIAKDGTVHEARLLEWDYTLYETRSRDWAVLELSDGDSLPSVGIAKPSVGELAIIFGFPDGVGIDADGYVAQGGASKRRGFLSALTTLASVAEPSPLVMKPETGCIPLGGLSGGPVFNGKGEVFAIFVSVSKSTRTGAVLHTYQAVAIDTVTDVLRRARSR